MQKAGSKFDDKGEVGAVDFFNQINMLYGTITEFCTEISCSVMSAGPRYEYHWADGTNIKKPIKCSAPKYIDYLMTWVQDQLDDETLFPSKIGECTAETARRSGEQLGTRSWQCSFSALTSTPLPGIQPWPLASRN
ncbi:UNVERIFIED_CONTAM: hypothetical protein FKN15_058955 [Acipenser sinensis]